MYISEQTIPTNQEEAIALLENEGVIRELEDYERVDIRAIKINFDYDQLTIEYSIMNDGEYTE